MGKQEGIVVINGGNSINRFKKHAYCYTLKHWLKHIVKRNNHGDLS